ncbi:MAG: class I SAM-dependent methyltransferase [Saprospiraceae bacterium]|nr:class I SAM-dependent methyltransferase [Saprospiraceae bacterium]MCB0624835.1 class I SAM-dependent methyltransferase [Saprospiraceae bacterium]MCB0678798.1 class I SAM-dependent methyltransferase [Saprospiraceae bacterium]MCB0680070.1 class I SAM-dependent methyltransferase [Saprospiraceae bacterium]
MNYKLLFPTYRNRYLFVRDRLREFAPETGWGNGLNLGTGEGDYDPMIARHCAELTACDINERDIAFARALNEGIPGIRYEVQDALALSFPADRFDFLVSVDVMEHVGDPARMTAEIGRVLRPGGLAFITFPQLYFPWTYDPINRLLSFFTGRRISQGAYAFGHEYLIDGADFRRWAEASGLEVLREQNLSGHLVALLEMYWTGWLQRIFKDNAGNVSTGNEKGVKLRPSLQESPLVGLTDLLIRIDRFLFGRGRHSVGKGFVVRKTTSM